MTKLISVSIYCNYHSGSNMCNKNAIPLKLKRTCTNYTPKIHSMDVKDDEDESKDDDRLTARTYASSLCVILWDFIGWII